MTATATIRTERQHAPVHPLAVMETVLIAIGLALLALGQRHQITSDGRARFDALTQLLESGRLSDNQYSLIGPLFATPLWLAGRLLGDVEAAVRQYNLVVFSLGLAALYGLLRNRVDRTLLRRFILLLVAGGMIAPHVTDFYGEVFTAVGVGVGIVAAVVRRGAGGWVAMVIGTASSPAGLVGLGLVSTAEGWRHRRLRYAIPLLAAAALVLAEAWLRRGDPFDSGYAGTVRIARTVMPYSGVEGFSYPFFFGLLSILFSFGKGILWYLPGLLLPVRRQLQELDLWRIWLLWTLFLGGLVLAYASWWSWYGGMYWGPRFFLIGILPASLGLAVALSNTRASLLANVGALAAVVVSVWIGANSLIFGGLWAWPCYENYFALEALCHYTPEFSALWYPFVARPALNGGQILQLCYYGAVLVCLALPLLGRIAAQVDGWFATRGREVFTPSRWRW